MALTQTQPAITIPMGRGGWEDQVVPALRKRLESESRTLARRISARSVSAEEEELPKSQSQSKSKLKSSNSNSSSSGRTRTYSELQPRQSSSSSQSRIPQRTTSRSRTRTRSGSAASASASASASGKPTTEPELSILHEQRSFVKDEQPPFNTYPSLNPADDPSRASTDSERPFEHWYRGEVSRNGGVGEYRVARKQEMLEIANYGYTTKARETTLNGVGGRRPRSGSLDSHHRTRDRSSFYMDPDDEDHQRVLDEGPLTDLERSDRDEERDTEADGYYDDMEDYYRPDSQTRSRTTTPTPTPSGIPKPSRIPRSTTPTTMQRGFSEGANGTTAGVARTVSPPLTTTSSTSKGKSPAGASGFANTTSRVATNGNVNGTARTKSPSSTPTPSKPSSSSTPQKAKKSKSPPSGGSRKPPPSQSQSQARKQDEYRRSIASYPDPGEDLENAIPSWTQPAGGAPGNWDDVVLPVVARKKGLDGHYERADGSPKVRAKKEEVEPAPGTFGFDHTKYRPPRDRDYRAGGGGESIPMDEFGARRGVDPPPPVADDLPSQQPELESETTQKQRNAHVPPAINTSGVRPAPTSGAGMPPISPAPFASYPPTAAGGDLERQQGLGQGLQGQEKEEEEKKGGCCGCVVM